MQPGAAILIAKSGISNHAASDIPDHLCFSKFGTFLVVCPQTTDNLRTFVRAPSWHQQTEHNRAKPLSELSSALFSIADDNEFGSRGYVLHSLVQFRYVICGCLAASICFWRLCLPCTVQNPTTAATTSSTKIKCSIDRATATPTDSFFSLHARMQPHSP